MSTAPKKKMGRPAIGVEVTISTRISPELARKLTAWAKARGLSKSQAIRAILAEAVGASVPKK
jgi:predicted DNA-binding protein